jgi:hypothetical protein
MSDFEVQSGEVAVKFCFGGHNWGSALALILRETGRPMSTCEIIAILQRYHFPTTTSDIYPIARAELARRASRCGDVKKVGKALWVAS